MSSEAWIGIGTVLLGSGLLGIALSRGFTLDSLSFFVFSVKLPTPFVVVARPRFYSLAIALFLAGGASVAWGSYERWFPPEWPTRLRSVHSAQLRLFDIDDVMIVRVNGQEIARATYGNPTGWIDFRQNLRQGMNVVEYVIQNTQFGGCGGSLEIRLNGMSRSDFRWNWFEQRGQRPFVVCFQGTRTFELD